MDRDVRRKMLASLVRVRVISTPHAYALVRVYSRVNAIPDTNRNPVNASNSIPAQTVPLPSAVKKPPVFTPVPALTNVFAIPVTV